MSTFDQPTPTNTVPYEGNTYYSGVYYVPDSDLTPLARCDRGIDAVLRRLETDLNTLRALLCERRHLESKP